MRLLRRADRNLPGTTYDGIEYTSRVVLPEEVRGRSKSLRGGYSRFRVARRRTSNAVLAVLIAFLGVFVTAGPASANPIDRLVDTVKDMACIFPDHEGRKMGTDPYRAIGIVGNDSDVGSWFNTAPRTAYEKYGMSGTHFSMYRGEKGLPDDDPMGRRGDCVQLANTISHHWGTFAFEGTKTISAITTFSYSLTNTMGTTVSSSLEPVLKNVVEGGDGFPGLRDTLWSPWLLVVLMIGALWLGWKGLVKKESSTAGAAALWMTMVVVTGYWYQYNTESVPEVTAMVTDGVNTSIADAFAGMGNGAIKRNDICWLPASAGNSGSGGAFADSSAPRVVTDRNTRIVECKIWETTVLIPWSMAQFGVPYNHPSLVTDQSIQIGNRTIDNASLALLQLEAQSRDATLLGPDAPANAGDAKVADWDRVRDAVADTQHFETWRGSELRGPVAAFSNIAALGMGALVILLSLLIVVLKIFRLIMLFFAPLFFLVGVHPGAGRRVLQWYGTTILGTVLGEVALNFLLSVMIFLFMSVAGIDMPYAVRLFMVIAFTVAGFMLMKKITGSFTGGAMSVLTQGTRPVTQLGAVAAGAGLGAGVGAAKAVGVAKAAGGGTAGMAAAVRTIAKSGAEGAMRSRYVRDPLSAGMMAVSGGNRAANAERGRATAERHRRDEAAAAAARETERANDPFAYVAEREAAEREAAAELQRIEKYQDDPEFVRRHVQQYGVHPRERLRAEQFRKRQEEVREYLAKKDDPAYMESLNAKYGGKVPRYFTDPVARRQYETGDNPRPQTDPRPQSEAPAGGHDSQPAPDAAPASQSQRGPFTPPAPSRPQSASSAETDALREDVHAMRRDQEDLRRRASESILRSRRTEQRQDASERRQEQTEESLNKARRSGLPPRSGR